MSCEERALKAQLKVAMKSRLQRRDFAFTGFLLRCPKFATANPSCGGPGLNAGPLTLNTYLARSQMRPSRLSSEGETREVISRVPPGLRITAIRLRPAPQSRGYGGLVSVLHYGLGGGVGRTLGVGAGRGVGVALGVGVGVGVGVAVAVAVAVGVALAPTVAVAVAVGVGDAPQGLTGQWKISIELNGVTPSLA